MSLETMFAACPNRDNGLHHATLYYHSEMSRVLSKDESVKLYQCMKCHRMYDEKVIIAFNEEQFAWYKERELVSSQKG